MSSGFGRLQSRRQFLHLLGGTGATLLAGLHDVRALEAHLPVVFTDVTARAGLLRAETFLAALTNKQFLLEEMGCGVAFFDYDNDGWLDIFLVNGTSLEPIQRDRHPTSYLFHNNRDGTFTDVTDKAGLTRSGWGKAVVSATTIMMATMICSSAIGDTMSCITTMATEHSQMFQNKPGWPDREHRGAQAAVFWIMIATVISTCLSRTT